MHWEKERWGDNYEMYRKKETIARRRTTAIDIKKRKISQNETFMWVHIRCVILPNITRKQFTFALRIVLSNFNLFETASKFLYIRTTTSSKP